MRAEFLVAAALAALAALVPVPALALQQAERSCPAGFREFAHIGLTAPLDCPGGGCIVAAAGPEGPHAEFRTEPRIAGLDGHFARSTGLRTGDVLVAVDGHLITTREGGRRWATMAPGTPVVLRVRREGREQELTVTPVRACAPIQATRLVPAAPPRPGAPPAAAPQPGAPPAAAPRPRALVPTPAPRPSAVPLTRPDAAPVPTPPPPAAARPPVPLRVDTGGPGTVRLAPRPATPRPRVALVPTPSPSLMPDGWLGFALQCDDCGMHADGPGGALRWFFSTPPRIYHIEPGSPADRGGLRTGDRIVSIDDVPLATPAGGAAFTAVRPGDRVRLVVQRDGEAGTRSRVLIAETRPGLQAAVLGELRRGSDAAGVPGTIPLRRLPASAQPLRFSGAIGTAQVEVRSPERVMVSETIAGEELEIVIGDTTVRVRIAPARR